MGAKTRKLSQINDSLIEWQSVVVADGSTGLTAVAGRGYFINTTAGAITVTLPSTTAKPGDVIQLKDYARTWATNNVNIASNTFDGSTNAASFSTNGQTVTLVYMDDTKGWSLINEDTTTTLGATFISATGGTVTTSGNFKIHTFTGDGCFVVATVGNPAGSTAVDYLVVAGGGGGGKGHAGGGGAGGFREGRQCAPAYTASPLVAPAGLPVSATTYPVTVGAGGAGAPAPGPGNPFANSNGSNSVFSTITSTGGGKGGGYSFTAGASGGSGGGAGGSCTPTSTGFSGNTPPTSPPQGNNGGNGNPPGAGGGGGGATATGANATNPGPNANGGNGGNGATTSISGTSTSYSGGGGGGNYFTPGVGGTGGTGGGGNGASVPGTDATVGSTNTGGGGGGGGACWSAGKSGGSGIVVIRYKFQ